LKKLIAPTFPENLELIAYINGIRLMTDQHAEKIYNVEKIEKSAFW